MERVVTVSRRVARFTTPATRRRIRHRDSAGVELGPASRYRFARSGEEESRIQIVGCPIPAMLPPQADRQRGWHRCDGFAFLVFQPEMIHRLDQGTRSSRQRTGAPPASSRRANGFGRFTRRSRRSVCCSRVVLLTTSKRDNAHEPHLFTPKRSCIACKRRFAN